MGRECARGYRAWFPSCVPRAFSRRGKQVKNWFGKVASSVELWISNWTRKFLGSTKTSKLPKHDRFSRHLFAAVPTILGISLTMIIAEHIGWLDRFETAGID